MIKFFKLAEHRNRRRNQEVCGHFQDPEYLFNNLHRDYIINGCANFFFFF